jgi:hypothetical protein
LESNDKSAEGLKWLTGGIAVAAAALTLAGLSGEEAVRLIRIHPWAFWGGVALLVFSTVCGVVGFLVGKRKRRVAAGMFGILFFMVGTLVLVWFHADAVGRQERPTATLALAESEKGYSALITVEAGGLKPDEYVFVLVQGLNSKRHLDPTSAEFTPSSERIPPGEYSKQRVYKGRVGPSPNGTVSVSFDVAIADQLYEQVVVLALIARPGESERELELEFGVGGERFACDSVSEDISCATVLVPKAPIANAEPTTKDASEP